MKKPTQKLVFTIEYIIDIEPTMTVELEAVLDKIRETADAQILNVEVRDV